MQFKRIMLLLLAGMLVSAVMKSVAQDVAGADEAGIVEHLDSIIPGGLTFRDENNNQVNLNDLIKKPTILTPIYFDCPGICPAILSSVANSVKKLDLQLGKDYQVVTVSFNELDDPGKAMDKKNAFMDEKSRPNAQYWSYLTGDSATIRALTNAAGYKFSRAGNDFIHPSCIIILSPERKITRYLYGTVYLPFDVKMALIEAQKGLSRPTINRVLDFCFTYDPEGRRYTLAVTQIAATIIIFIAVVFFIFLLIRTSRKKSKSNKSADPSSN
jgi:protein SCO1/2